MSTSANPPTKQQLDEIDSLLRRMLSLPPLATDANGGTKATDLPPPRVVEYSPPPQYIPPPSIREIPAPQAPAPTDPVVQSWRVSWPQAVVPTQAPNSGSVAAWGVPVAPSAPTMPPAAQLPFANPVPAPTQTPTPFFPLPAENAPSKMSPLAFPFVALNFLFDIPTYLLGPLGAWIRDDGRRLMGWLGVLMLMGSGAWAVGEWQGVDWPKINWEKLNIPRPDWTK
jgi:hypothetical protein